MLPKHIIRRLVYASALVVALGCNVDEADEALDGDIIEEADGEFFNYDVGTEPEMDTANIPEQGQCTEDSQCAGEGQTCLIPEGAQEGTCGECSDHTYCPEERPFCNADGICTDEDEGICRENLDCEEDPRLQCRLLSESRVGFCVECLSDDDCVAPRPTCATTGLCAPRGQTGCETNDECGPLLNCVEATCVEP